jgi:hypothetical protein
MTRLTPGAGEASQLLGRIVYFHALLIEGAATAPMPAIPGPACCAHASARGAGHCVRGTWPVAPWAVLGEVAATMPGWYRPCPSAEPGCCACCAIAAAAAAVGAGWADAECRAYDRDPDLLLAGACGTAAAVRISTAAAVTLQNGDCQARAARAAEAGRPAPVTTGELPVTGELLALWDPRGGAGPAPVVSWLNHCASLADARKVLARRNSS